MRHVVKITSDIKNIGGMGNILCTFSKSISISNNGYFSITWHYNDGEWKEHFVKTEIKKTLKCVVEGNYTESTFDDDGVMISFETKDFI